MTAGTDSFDIVVIGAGMAGASVAAELAQSARVVLLERESRPGYHTTGRSAAVYTSAYGPPVIRALTRASANAFAQLGDHPLLRPRGVLFAVRDGQQALAAALESELGPAVTPVSARAARDMMPLLRADGLAGALLDQSAADIDVDGLHQYYLRAFRAADGELRCGSEVLGLSQGVDGWRIETSRGTIRAERVVNAAGAWADVLAGMAGVRPVGLVPKRRTVALVAPPAGFVPDGHPMVVGVDESYYLKPDAGKLLISPADETPSPPCDAQPEDWDIAVCVDRIETVFDLSVRRIEHKWAGLRSFVADKSPVVGYATEAPGFFWLAGQGGYGIQSAPALAQVAAALVLGRPVPDQIAAQGVTAAALSPDRKGLN
ncbi:MAG: FAD-binding oxidoreductase [Gemmobacter sp.]|nr:FAD-binding oxidoreductase [Gemmobacter sp.]